jgi:hypothetical protein
MPYAHHLASREMFDPRSAAAGAVWGCSCESVKPLGIGTNQQTDLTSAIAARMQPSHYLNGSTEATVDPTVRGSTIPRLTNAFARLLVLASSGCSRAAAMQCQGADSAV